MIRRKNNKNFPRTEDIHNDLSWIKTISSWAETMLFNTFNIHYKQNISEHID